MRVLGTQEDKFIDFGLNYAAVQNFSVRQSLFTVAQGAGESQRIGRRITVTKISFRWHVSQDNILSQSIGLLELEPQTCIIALVLDTQANGANALASDIYQNPARDTTFNDLPNSKRFRTLFRRELAIPSGSISAEWRPATAKTHYTLKGGRTPVYTWSTSCKLPVLYSGNTATVADIVTNNLLFVTSFSSDIGGMAGNVRIRYVDS